MYFSILKSVSEELLTFLHFIFYESNWYCHSEWLSWAARLAQTNITNGTHDEHVSPTVTKFHGNGSLKRTQRWTWIKGLRLSWNICSTDGFWSTIDYHSPPTLPYTHSVHVSSTSNYWQGCSPNLRWPWDQVMLPKRINGNWILLA